MSLPEKYSNDDMERILQRAMVQRSLSGNISRDQLIEVGKELGLSEQDIERAVEEEMRYGALDDAKEEVIEKYRQGWREHLLWYLGVNAILYGLNFVQEDGHITWALGTTFGWGIGIVADTIGTFFPNEKKLNKAAKKLLRKRDKYNELGE
jgi:2TM domain